MKSPLPNRSSQIVSSSIALRTITKSIASAPVPPVPTCPIRQCTKAPIFPLIGSGRPACISFSRNDSARRASLHTSTKAMDGTTKKLDTDESCVPCRKGAPRLSADEIAVLLQELNGKASGWQVITRPSSNEGTHGASIPTLSKSYTFKNFRTALAFTNAVGNMAETQKHHPEILLEWGHVRVVWWTHAINGLHRNDFLCASKTDSLAASAEGIKIPSPATPNATS